MPRGRKKRPAPEPEPEPEQSGGSDGEGDGNDEEGEGEGGGEVFFLSQQPPEASQPALPAKANERTNLANLHASTREHVVTDLSRLLLFKALQGEPIDRLRSWKEVAGERSIKERVAGAAFEEASARLRDVFGFQLRRVPKSMEQNLPKKFSDRLYVVNKLGDFDNGDGGEGGYSPGEHSVAMHSVHADAAVDRGLLMLILAFAHCRGEVRRGHRWLSAESLYRLLNSVDENIPDEPPDAGDKKRRGSAATSSAVGTHASPSRFRRRAEEDLVGPHASPDVDRALDQFVHADYLLRERVTKLGVADSHASQVGHRAMSASATAADEGATVEYAMGPRAAMEIGRKQVVHFLAEVMGEEPDPTMLAEIEEEEGEEDEEEEEEGGEDEEEEREEGARAKVKGER